MIKQQYKTIVIKETRDWKLTDFIVKNTIGLCKSYKIWHPYEQTKVDAFSEKQN